MAPARVLEVAFDSEAEFRSEYTANLANGGIFVATDESFDTREQVRIRIALEFCGRLLELDGEVVHVVPAEMAAAGATPGVAIHLLLAAAEIRERVNDCVPMDSIPGEQEIENGRRRAVRSPARVRAEVQEGERVRLRGRTRNLSASGALVACEGEVVPLGTSVSLSLTHPISGECRSVSGRVVRHVTGADGAITGLAVEFVVPEAEQAELSQFVADLNSGEHSRRLGGIHGDIAEVGVASVVQMLTSSAPQGVITLIRGGEEGTLVFVQGSLRAATLGAQKGIKALSELLGWPDGEFQFHSQVDEELDTQPEFEAMPVEAALLEATRAVDEEQHSQSGDEGPEIDDDLLEAMLSGVGDDLDGDANGDDGLELDPAATLRWCEDPDAELSEAEQSLRDLARVGMSVAKAISIIPESEDEVRAVLGNLVRRGLVALD
ncbi:MAG: PilZ domain-containing protein [Myxococcota bacterium]